MLFRLKNFFILFYWLWLMQNAGEQIMQQGGQIIGHGLFFLFRVRHKSWDQNHQITRRIQVDSLIILFGEEDSNLSLFSFFLLSDPIPTKSTSIIFYSLKDMYLQINFASQTHNQEVPLRNDNLSYQHRIYYSLKDLKIIYIYIYVGTQFYRRQYDTRTRIRRTPSLKRR